MGRPARTAATPLFSGEEECEAEAQLERLIRWATGPRPEPSAVASNRAHQEARHAYADFLSRAAPSLVPSEFAVNGKRALTAIPPQLHSFKVPSRHDPMRSERVTRTFRAPIRTDKY